MRQARAVDHDDGDQLTALPKPPRRGPKPRKPIPRSPLRRKRSDAAIVRALVRQYDRRHANPLVKHRKLVKLCDDLFGLYIVLRDGRQCRLCRSIGVIQCAHLISRRYAQSRHLEENAWALCHGCHVKYTHDPLGWDALVERVVGVVEWARRKSIAQIPVKPDYSTMAVFLRAKLELQAGAGAYGLDERVAKAFRDYDKLLGG